MYNAINVKQCTLCGVSTVVAADNAANEEFEVIGMDQRNWLKKMVGDLTKASTAKQVIAGGLSGWSVHRIVSLTIVRLAG